MTIGFRETSEASEYAYSKVKADVIFTIVRKEHQTIEYGAESTHLPNHAVFVALCDSGSMGLYQPDTGFIFPATEELIDFLKNTNINNAGTEKKTLVNETCKV